VKQDWKGVGTYGTVGLEVVLSVLVGLFGGSWLDKRLGTGPWLTVVGVVYGVAAAARALYRAARRATKEAEELDRREREERRKFRDRNDGS
jgi:F0F1-type ATP synthase assembly protein I